ncbi:uncharacterized protein LOC108931788 [Scleropages formosus]|nr:uncharacterized protein LOC108931788 [Scleropages formosus]
MAPPVAPDSPHWLPHFGFCSRRKRRANEARLRMRSLPGVFLLLGAVVVLVGTAMAVASYWPHRAHRSALLGHAGPGKSLSEPPAARWGPGARSALTASGVGHHDRMRLLGPVIMGVGLFILICANTVLYENRDHDTRLQFREARGPRHGVSAAEPTAVQCGHYHWMTKLNVGDVDILRAGRLSDSPAPPAAAPLLLSAQEAPCCSSSSWVSSSTNCRAFPAQFRPEPQLSSSTDLQLDRRLETGSEWDAAVPPRRSYSLGCRTVPASSGLGDKDSKDDTDSGHDVASRPLGREPSSSVCVNVAELSCWSPGGAEEWRCSSWPRLDFDGDVTSWESRRESMDRLLD